MYVLLIYDDKYVINDYFLLTERRKMEQGGRLGPRLLLDYRGLKGLDPFSRYLWITWLFCLIKLNCRKISQFSPYCNKLCVN